jgi:hypothetical protein
MFDRRLGRLQQQSWAAFIAADRGEVSSDAIAAFVGRRAVLLHRRRPTKCERDCMIRAARSIGAYRVRRDTREGVAPTIIAAPGFLWYRLPQLH